MPESPRKRSWRAPLRSALALLVSLGLHLPLMPIVLLMSLMWRIDRAKEAADIDYRNTEATIAVDLLSPSPSLESHIESALPEARVDDAPGASEPFDWGERGESSDSRIEFIEVDLEPARDDAESDASLSIFDEEANIVLSLWISTMRQHALAPTLKTLLQCGKLGATLRRAKLEAFEDIETAVFAGPRLDDPAQYTGAFSHSLSELRLRQAFARLTSPNGRWIDDTAVRIQAAGATRIVSHREPSLVLVTPERVYRELRGSSRRMSMPGSAGRALSIKLREPSMVLRRLGLDLPDSLERIYIDAYPQKEGGVDIRIRFEDRDETAARAHLPKVSNELESAFREFHQAMRLSRFLGPWLGQGRALKIHLPRIHFRSQGSNIIGMASLGSLEAEATLSSLTPFVCEHPAPKAGPGR